MEEIESEVEMDMQEQAAIQERFGLPAQVESDSEDSDIEAAIDTPIDRFWKGQSVLNIGRNRVENEGVLVEPESILPGPSFQSKEYNSALIILLIGNSYQGPIYAENCADWIEIRALSAKV